MNRNVSLEKLTLQDEFEIQGYWWLPEEPDKRLSGILYSGEDAIYLDVLESFKGFESADSTSNYGLIHGFTVKGDEVTLFDSVQTNINTNMPGIEKEKIICSYFITGGHFSNQNDAQFKSVELYSEDLTNWFNKNPFRLEKNKESSEITTTYTPPDVTPYYIESIKAEIQNSYNLNQKFSPKASIFKYSEFIKLTPDNHGGFEWFQEKLFSFQKLISLMMGERLNYERIVFRGEDENWGTEEEPLTKPKRYHLFVSLRENEINEKLHSHKMLFTFPNIEDQFEEICNNWFGKEEYLKNVYSLHFSDVFNPNLDLEDKFTNAVKSLEVYHRALDYGKLFDEQKKDEILKNVNEQLNGVLEVSDLELVLNGLKHINEYSLNSRLKDIIKKQFNQETKQYLFKNSKKTDSFINRVVETRNHLTHYDEQRNENRFKGVELHFAKELLKVIALIALLKECGIKEGKVLDRLQNTFRISQNVTRGKERLGIDK
ncbi:ApeA N-terminal domain 1-containing protein [Salimicrobium humidisoli]|uniref:ApeA N-terminal domain-containing protein n=1 Tax=Salimicrobium humidisoli TaxID=2029857 RepID=A0ABX4HQ74_9BACI|nr:HEPN domain-containing protein [Salimicrobium humidisoli]PBB04974.1 hypothetical protein CKW00_11180 [Salimicrobium humidisoli]